MVTTTGTGIGKAINAYQAAAKAADTDHAKAAGKGEDFGDLVRGAIKEAIRIGEKSEKLSIEGVNGRADINEVVTAVSEAEVTLKTVVAVRDKVIDAYREIMRMPI